MSIAVVCMGTLQFHKEFQVFPSGAKKKKMWKNLGDNCFAISGTLFKKKKNVSNVNRFESIQSGGPHGAPFQRQTGRTLDMPALHSENWLQEGEILDYFE